MGGGQVGMAGEQSELATISEVIRAARSRLPQGLWDHSAGGVGTETTLRRNRQAFETLAFRPRLLRGVGTPEIHTTFLGRRLESPVMLAPVGTIAQFSRNGSLGPARVAAKRGTILCYGVMTSPDLTTVGAEAQGHLMLQLYIRGDRSWLKETVQKAEDAGYLAICVTADSIGGGIRDRDLHNRFRANAGVPHPNLPPDGGHGLEHQLDFDWDDFAWLRSITKLPTMIKGITSVEDACAAVELGCAAVYVSNHGGRALDHLPSSIEVLPEIVEAVDGKAEVILDSGILRGTDVIKAMALGAKAVLVGKLQAWGLAAGEEAGLDRALGLLDSEIRESMQLLGVKTLDELRPSHVRPSTPTRLAPDDWNHYQPAPIPRL
jgi:isopentenyl diphosphate isomerase/L-lactate dehydrogenase-like FMN-dependent dehydrogenase